MLLIKPNQYMIQLTLSRMIFSTLKPNSSEGHLSPQTKNKTFQVLNHQCLYTNSAKVTCSSNKMKPNDLIIRNYVTKIDGRLQKTTEICVNNETIVLRDDYQLEVFHSANEQKIIHKKPYKNNGTILFKNKHKIQGKNSPKQIDEKKVKKNIVQWFINYLRVSRYEAFQLKQNQFIFKRKKFDHRFLQKVVENPETGRDFKNFLLSHVQEHICQFRKAERSVYEECILGYLKLFEDKQTKNVESVSPLDMSLEEEMMERFQYDEELKLIEDWGEPQNQEVDSLDNLFRDIQ